MSNKPIVSEASQQMRDTAQNATDSLAQEPVNALKAVASQIGIAPQQSQAQDQKIADLTKKDESEKEIKLKEARKKLIEEHHEAAEQLGVQPLQSVQSQPSGPEIKPAKKLEPYAPLTPGKSPKPGEDLTNVVRPKQGTRETKLRPAA